MRRLTTNDLRRIIKEEINLNGRRPMRSRKSLSSFIFEDVGDEIAKAAAGGPGAVRSFVDTYPDKKELKTALQGTYDDVPDDDDVNIGSPTSRDVKDFLPTQSQIDLLSSIGYPLGDGSSLEKMIKTNTSTAPGSITVSGNLVIDGHHRWSGVWGICGPDGTVSVEDLDLPGSTTKDKLAAAQLAVAAFKPETARQPSADDPIPLNILGSSPEQIKSDILSAEGQTGKGAPGPVFNPKMIEYSKNSKVIADWAGFTMGDDDATVKNKIAEKVGMNLAGLPANPDAPPRADMPQMDGNKELGEKEKVKAGVYNGLRQGQWNVKEPFEPANETFRRSEDEFIMERWQKLAGLIKG